MFALLVLSVAWAEPPLTSTFPADAITTVFVRAPNGTLVVEAAADATTVDVSVVREEWSEGCTVESKVVGERVEVAITKMEGRVAQVCSADVRIRVPPRLAIDLEAVTGEVSVGGITGGGRVTVGVGDLRLADVSGPLEISGNGGDLVGSYTGTALRTRWTSGEVRLTGLVGTADVEVGVGSLDLAWTQLPAAGEIRLDVGGGGLTARFPDGARLAQDLDTTLGKVRSDLPSEETAPVRLRARTKAGSLRVLKN